MKVLVVGASRGTGLATVEQLLEEGHEVTALSRHPDRLPLRHERLHALKGDALQPADLASAVRGQDAVIVTLGISDNPLRVRLLGPASTSIDVRSRGTRLVIEAMRAEGVRRLVVLSSYGVGTTRRRLRLRERLFFQLLLAPQIADTERQEQVVKASGLDWVLVQPVHLTDGPDEGLPVLSTAGEVERRDVPRRSVARALVRAATDGALVGQIVAVSGAMRGEERRPVGLRAAEAPARVPGHDPHAPAPAGGSS